MPYVPPANKTNSGKGAVTANSNTSSTTYTHYYKNAFVTTRTTNTSTAYTHAGLNPFIKYNTIETTKPKPKPTPQPSSVLNTTPDLCRFNLPPHRWSLPIDPNQLSSSTEITSPSAYRLARLWSYAPAVSSSDTTDISTLYQNPDGTTATGSNKSASVPTDTNWGFQFLWNPTSITTNVNLNQSVTPNPTDAHAGANSLFTATEQISFTIVIDRVNDFACAKGLSSPMYTPGRSNSNGSTPSSWSPSTDPGSFSKLQTFYTSGYRSISQASDDMSTQISDLLKLGTMADIEYIYRAINGSGINGQLWTNALGKKTADIAFLNPSSIAVQFGPSLNNLAYVGYVSGMSITHSVFTQDMLPLHSEISMQFLGFSQLSLSSGAI